MPDEAGPTLWILCPPSDSVEVLERLPARALSQLWPNLRIDRSDGDIGERVQRARREHGPSALGVVAVDEYSALAAIEAGADDSITAGCLDERSALAFVDRVLLRARLRVERQEMRALYVHHEKLAALGTLVAGVAHEVNNPLTALLLTIEALKQRSPLAPSSEQAAELLDEVEISARSIAAVVRDLKVFSRPDSDDAPSELVDVPALIDQVLRVVGRQIRTFAALELDYEPGLPDVVVPAARLAQVFTNLLVNASHAVSQVSRPLHRVRIVARSNAETITISVSDTGPGMPEAVVPRIFEPFFTTKERGAGTGLGLSISRSILRRFGGDLWVKSVQGAGATFVVAIPRPSGDELAAARERRRSVPGELEPVARRRRLLVVESDPRVLRAIGRALESSFDVVSVLDAQDAIDRLRSGPGIDLVLSEVSAPDLSGLEVERWLRAHGHPLAAKMIFMMAEEQDAPADGLPPEAPVLFKPIRRNALLRAVREQLG